LVGACMATIIKDLEILTVTIGSTEMEDMVEELHTITFIREII
tara:strand:- start:2210 stop:2338 length:129 start_codon:yes stop_codon:yes gene_type:complete